MCHCGYFANLSTLIIFYAEPKCICAWLSRNASKSSLNLIEMCKQRTCEGSCCFSGNYKRRRHSALVGMRMGMSPTKILLHTMDTGRGQNKHSLPTLTPKTWCGVLINRLTPRLACVRIVQHVYVTTRVL